MYWNKIYIYQVLVCVYVPILILLWKFTKIKKGKEIKIIILLFIDNKKYSKNIQFL